MTLAKVRISMLAIDDKATRWRNGNSCRDPFASWCTVDTWGRQVEEIEMEILLSL